MTMLFYFEFSYIQILLNIHMNELLFCKLISNTIYICMYVCMYVCMCVRLHIHKCDVKYNFYPPLKSNPDSAFGLNKLQE